MGKAVALTDRLEADREEESKHDSQLWGLSHCTSDGEVYQDGEGEVYQDGEGPIWRRNPEFGCS